MLVVLDDVIVDMEANKQLSFIVTEMFLRGRKFDISLVVISQSYSTVLKTIRLDATCLIMKTPIKG